MYILTENMLFIQKKSYNYEKLPLNNTTVLQEHDYLFTAMYTQWNLVLMRHDTCVEKKGDSGLY